MVVFPLKRPLEEFYSIESTTQLLYLLQCWRMLTSEVCQCSDSKKEVLPLGIDEEQKSLKTVEEVMVLSRDSFQHKKRKSFCETDSRS